MRARTRWIAGLSAVAILLTATFTASAYTGQVDATASVAVRGTVTCDEPFTLVATFTDTMGAPVEGLSVDWTFAVRLSASDKIDETPTVTNAEGVATTTVSLAAVNGDRRIRAAADGVRASVVVTQACGGLPRTSTAPGGGIGPGLLLLLVVLGFATGARVALRRRA